MTILCLIDTITIHNTLITQYSVNAASISLSTCYSNQHKLQQKQPLSNNLDPLCDYLAISEVKCMQAIHNMAIAGRRNWLGYSLRVRLASLATILRVHSILLGKGILCCTDYSKDISENPITHSLTEKPLNCILQAKRIIQSKLLK